MKLSGIIVPTLTPMDARGERLNLDAVAPTVEFLISRGVHALFVNGTTGEGPLLSIKERKEHLEEVLAAASRRIPVAVQVGSLTTRESIELAVHAAESGADAVACMTPYFFAYSERELKRYFLDIARAISETPVYLYTIPSRTGNTVSPALVQRLAQEANIIGIKDSTGDMVRLLQYLAIPNFIVLPGADLLALPGLQAGAAGVVSGPAGIFPEPYVAMWNAWKEQDHASLGYWYGLILKLVALVEYGARLDIFKALAQRRVRGVGAVRPPLSQAPPAQLEAMTQALYRLLHDSRLNEEAYAWLA